MYWTATYRMLAAVLLLAAYASPVFAEPAEEQYALAAGYYSQSRWPEAIQQFDAFLASHPGHPRADDAVFFTGESLVQLGKYDEARTTFDRFLERAPRHRYARQARFRTGETAYLTGKNVEARRSLEKFCEQYPDDALAAYALPYLGELALVAGDSARAQTWYARALDKFPGGPLADECRFGLGKALEQQGQEEQAQRFYEFLAQDSRRPLADDALLQLGVMHFQGRRYDKSIATLEDLTRRFPTSDLLVHARYWLGKGQAEQGQWELAAATFVSAAADSPAHELAPAIEFAAAEALRKAGKTSDAAEHYAHVWQQWPQSAWGDDSLQARIELAWNNGDHAVVDELAAEFESHFPDSPLLPVVRQAAGRSLLKREEFIRAIAVFEQLGKQPGEQSDSDKANRNYWLALAYIGTSRFDDALAALDRVHPVTSQSELVAAVYAARAAALFGLDDHQRAVEAQREYLAAQPNGPDAARCRAQLAASLAHLGRLPEAAAALDELKRIQPADPLLPPTTLFLAESAYKAEDYALAAKLYTELSGSSSATDLSAKSLSGLAWTQIKTGDLEEAAATFERLVEKHPHDPLAAESAFTRARVLDQLGQPEAAVAAYRHVIDNYPRAEQVPAALLAAARLLEKSGDTERRQQAAKLLDRVVSDFPGQPRLDAALYQLAWLQTDLQQPTAAMLAFQHISSEFPASEFWADATYRLAEQAVRDGDNPRAIELADKIIESQSEGEILSHAWYLKGQIAASELRWADVTSAMNQLVEQFPDGALRVPASYWIAEAFYRQGEYPEAMRRFNQLAREIDGRDDTWLAMVPLRQAQLHAQEKNWDQAFELATGIATRFPGFRQQYEVDYLLGRCLENRAQFNEAREAYQRVVRSPSGARTETAAMAEWMIGESYFHQKNYDEAIKAYHRVETLYAFPRWQAAALLQSGKCHELKGDRSTAVKLYAQLLKKYPETTFNDEAARRLAAIQ